MHLSEISILVLCFASASLARRASQAITISTSKKYQTMDGFGFAEAFGDAIQVVDLVDSQREKVIDLLYNKTSGAGMSILRNLVNYDLVLNAPSSPEEKPTYSWDAFDQGQLWFTQKAASYGVETIYADAWTAPAYMKTNQNISDGGYICGVVGEKCVSGDWREAYAEYLIQYMRFYKESGISFSHVGFLNEPDFVATYASMISGGYQAADFIKVFHEALKRSEFSQVGMTCCDSMGWDNQANMTKEIQKSGTEKLLSVITSHSYSTQPTYKINTNLPVWITENAPLTSDFTASWYSSGEDNEGLAWANNIMDAIIEADVSAYLYWIGAEYNTNSAHLVNVNNDTITPSSRFWAFVPFSRYIRPGAKRVEATSLSSAIKAAAFVNTDGSLIVNLINNGAETDVTISLTVNDLPEAFLVDNNHTMEMQKTWKNGNKIHTIMPDRSLVVMHFKKEKYSM
ncbi:glycosidase [Dipodascopsis uninucleata]